MVTTATPTVRTWGPNALPVPYTAPWTSERTTARTLVVNSAGTGLTYEDETPADRDRNGVLWARLTPAAPGTGRPNYRGQHPHRQRDAMLARLCQVCAGPADRNAKGWLFLVPGPFPDDAPASFPEGGLSTKPPLCVPCARLALRHCPHLGDALFVRSRKPRAWGVFGGAYVPGPDGALTGGDDALMAYGQPGAGWFLASQAVVELTRCTRVSSVEIA